MSTDVIPSYGSTYGPLFFAAILSTGFYGVTIMQTLFYYVHYPNDLPRIKILVAILLILDTIHEALTLSGIYRYTLAGLVNPSSFNTVNIELLFQYLPTTLLAVITQGFFVYRIYIFSGENITPPIIYVILALIELVCGTLYIAKAAYSGAMGIHVVPNNVLNTGSCEIIATVILSVAAGADVLIAICLTFLLIREWIAIDNASTAHVLQRLVMLAVNTGIWTASFALLTIVLLHAFPMGALYTMFSIPLGSVYCNTILANLNARTFLQSDLATDDTMFFGTGSTSQVSKGKHRRDTGLFSSHQRRSGTAMEMATFQNATESSTTVNV